jgi:hypothetical protein
MGAQVPFSTFGCFAGTTRMAPFWLNTRLPVAAVTTLPTDVDADMGRGECLS